MQEEINQIEKNKTLELIPRPDKKNVVGGKQVFRNKLNEDDKVIRNKARFYAKDMLSKKELILVKHLHQLQGWNQS